MSPVPGLPVLRVPLTKSLRKFFGLRNKTTTAGSKSAPSFALGTIGQISSTGRSKNVSDVEGDSVEDLIVDDRGIQVTRGFSTNATETGKKESYDVTVRQYPNWRVDEEKYAH
jgi:hypothetical protein